MRSRTALFAPACRKPATRADAEMAICNARACTHVRRMKVSHLGGARPDIAARAPGAKHPAVRSGAQQDLPAPTFYGLCRPKGGHVRVPLAVVTGICCASVDSARGPSGTAVRMGRPFAGGRKRKLALANVALDPDRAEPRWLTPPAKSKQRRDEDARAFRRDAGGLSQMLLVEQRTAQSGLASQKSKRPRRDVAGQVKALSLRNVPSSNQATMSWPVQGRPLPSICALESAIRHQTGEHPRSNTPRPLPGAALTCGAGSSVTRGHIQPDQKSLDQRRRRRSRHPSPFKIANSRRTRNSRVQHRKCGHGFRLHRRGSLID